MVVEEGGVIPFYYLAAHAPQPCGQAVREASGVAHILRGRREPSYRYEGLVRWI